MAKIIVNGARMRCTLGTTEARIGVTSHTFVKVGGALVATETDKEPMVNIPTFGTCKCGWPNSPCIPQPQRWQQTAQSSGVNGAMKLTTPLFASVRRVGASRFMIPGIMRLLKASECKAKLF